MLTTHSPIDFDTITAVVVVPDPAAFHHYGFSVSTLQGKLVCSMQRGVPLSKIGRVDFGCSQGSVHIGTGSCAIEWSADSDVARGEMPLFQLHLSAESNTRAAAFLQGP